MTTSAIPLKAESPTESARPSGKKARLLIIRIAVALVSITACLVGLLPAVLFIRDGESMLIVTLAVIGLAVMSVSLIRPTHLNSPSLLEVLASFISAIFVGSMGAFISLGFYLLGDLLYALTSLVAGTLDWTLPFDRERVAVFSAYVIGGLILPGSVVMTAKGLMQSLFPSIAGYSTPFRKWLNKRWMPVIVGAAFGLVAVYVWLAFNLPLGRFGAFTNTILALVIMMVTGMAWSSAQQETRPRAFTSSEQAIGELLKSLGFTLLPQPRTGRAEVDPYLVDVDFLAEREGRTLVVLVTAPNISEVQLVQKTSSVVFAARALVDALEQLGSVPGPIDPVLVVLRSSVTLNVRAFAQHQGVALVHVESEEELAGVHSDPTTMRAFAERLFDKVLNEEPETVLSGYETLLGTFSASPRHRPDYSGPSATMPS